ncbi:MAG: hypothetical protein WCC14_03815 [Acidobacteriaceae bacterium]
MRVCRSASALFFALSASLLAQAPANRLHLAPRPETPVNSSTPAQLPIRRVVLYKNGVGYFEHVGRVTGDQALTIDFTSSQLNDVLQSLTALDLGGGRITSVDYNSATPLDQQLQNIPLGLGEKPTTMELYAALRGARVEVSGAGQAPVTGRIVHYEVRADKTTAQGGTEKERVLTIVTDAGDIRSLAITPAVSVQVLDGDLRRDLDDYLALLASTQSRQVRHLTLEAQGTGSREIRVSYISEVPVWKSTYRIVFPPVSDTSAAPAPGTEQSAILQGWAVVDNTGGSDWDNVQLSLVAGAPQSFIEPLSQPIYTQRPVVPVPEAENVAPQIPEEALQQNTPVAAPTQSVTVQAPPLPQLEPRLRKYWAGGEAGGVLGGIGRGYGGGVMHTLQDESASTTSAKFDDFFEYTLAQPVTIHRNQSALVPFLQTNVQASQVTLWNPDNPIPLRALWLTNSSKETLDRGSFSVFENGEFAGEGLTDPIHAGEKRLLSYAVDQAVHVTTESNLFSTHLHHLSVHNGYLTERTEEIREVTYVVHNAATDSRDVIVEHPVQSGWTINSDPAPIETTASWYRFNVVTPPGETVRLHVGEVHPERTTWQLTGISDDQLTIMLNGAGDRPAIEKALAPVLSARAKVHDLDSQIAAKRQAIDNVEADSTRLHNNLQGLRDSEEERALARRYAGEMNADEDQLQSLRKDLADLQQQRTAAQQALDQAIGNLDLDEDV